MEIVLPLFFFGALVGGLTGLALTKWPAKTLLGSSLKGAALAVGILFVAVLFLSLIAFVLSSSFVSDSPGPSS